MRVHLNYAPLTSHESNHSSEQTTPATSSFASNGPEGEDQAQPFGVQLQTLAAQLPEVREERVHALRLAIQNGDFQITPEEVARAMFAYMIAGSAVQAGETVSEKHRGKSKA